MQANDFEKLSLERKLQWLYFEGEFVMDIRYYEFKVNLYQYQNFFIEVFYHHRYDRVTKIRLLDRKSSRMQFYADQVKLESVA